MKSGELRHRIEVFRQALVSDGCGGQEETFVTKGSCWAEIKGGVPVKDDEVYKDRKIESIGDFSLKTRFNNGITFEQTDVIKFGARLFRLQGFTNALEHNFKYSLKCYEIEGDSVTIP